MFLKLHINFLLRLYYHSYLSRSYQQGHIHSGHVLVGLRIRAALSLAARRASCGWIMQYREIAMKTKEEKDMSIPSWPCLYIYYAFASLF